MQKILVELSEGNAVDGTWGASEGKEFTEFIPILKKIQTTYFPPFVPETEYLFSVK